MPLSFPTSLKSGLPTLLVGCCILLLAAAYGCWPISMVNADSDLWYHLAGGRYLFTHHAIPDNAWFSYLTPTRTFANYYWLFQALVYGIYWTLGPLGLIALRALIFVALSCCLWGLFRPVAPERLGFPGALLLGIILFALLPRTFYLLRPHLFSYLFSAATLLLLERHRTRLWLLPPIFFCWGNIHGMEFPVAGALLGIYGLSWLVQHHHPATRSRLIWLGLAAGALFLTPHGLTILQAPFQLSPLISRLINEMHPVTAEAFLMVNLTNFSALAGSAQRLLLLIAIGLAVPRLRKRELAIHHLLLLVLACLLLWRANRFAYEAVLLITPVLAAVTFRFPTAAQSAHLPLLQAMAAGVVLLVIPILFLAHILHSRPLYPEARSGTPAGVVNFLNSIKTGGRILNQVDNAGYLEYHLDSSYTLNMDLQMSLFSAMDFLRATTAPYNQATLAAELNRYDPSFILVAHQRADKAVLAAFPQFIPVFFDDTAVVYCNRDKLPEVVRRNRLSVVDPKTISSFDIDTLATEKLPAMVKELEQVYTRDPAGRLINRILGNLRLLQGHPKAAKRHMRQLQRLYPRQPDGYLLQGKIALAAEDAATAVTALERALALTRGRPGKELYYNLHLAYAKLDRPNKAYEILVRYAPVTAPDLSYQEITRLGIYAAKLGKRQEAATFLSLALERTPEEDSVLRRQLQTILNQP